MRGVARVLSLVLVSVLLMGIAPTSMDRAAPSPPTVEAVSGTGVWGAALCIGCGVAIVASAGATWGGFLVVSFFHADAVVACGYVCYRAIT